MLLHSALLLMEQKELASRKEASNLGGMRKQASDLREKFDQQRRIAIAKQLEVILIWMQNFQLNNLCHLCTCIQTELHVVHIACFAGADVRM